MKIETQLVPYDYCAKALGKDNQMPMPPMAIMRDGIAAMKHVVADTENSLHFREAGMVCLSNLLVRFQLKARQN